MQFIDPGTALGTRAVGESLPSVFLCRPHRLDNETACMATTMSFPNVANQCASLRWCGQGLLSEDDVAKPCISAQGHHIVVTRIGSPEGGRPIFPGPWPENCALPACAADLVPDALAETQTPSGARSVHGARSDLMSDLMSELMSDFMPDSVSGNGSATVRVRGPIPDPIFSCCGARRSGRNKIGREIGRKIGRRNRTQKRTTNRTTLGAPQSTAPNATLGHRSGLKPSADSRTVTANPLDGNPPGNLPPGTAKKI